MSGISLNGESKDFLERFYRLENRMDNAREDTAEIKKDLKEIKDCLVPLANKVYFHDRFLKFIGVSLSLLVTASVVLIAALL